MSATVNLAGIQSLSQSRHANLIRTLWLQIPDTARSNPEFLGSLYALLPRCRNLMLVTEVRSLTWIEMRGKRAPMEPYQWSNVESDMILSPEALRGLANNCARTLWHLHLNAGLPVFRSFDEFKEIFYAMGQLRELRSLMMCGNFQTVGDLAKVDVSVGRFHPDAFPRLERLFVRPNCTFNKVFIYALCSARCVPSCSTCTWRDPDLDSRLPALTYLQIIDSFQPEPDPSIEKLLSVHGRKLTHLKSHAHLGDLFKYCTSVIGWHATCMDADDWVSAILPLDLHV